MSETLPTYRRAFNYLWDAKITVAASMGILVTNLMCGDSLVVHSNDSIEKQMEMAFPSAFATPDATGIKPLDFAGATATTLISLEAARRTTSLGGLAATAVVGQLVSCEADTLIDQTSWISNATDGGSSGIGAALATKFLLDRTASAENETTRRRWKVASALFAGSMTLGAYLFLGDDGKLDMISHASAIAVGATAYRFGSWRKKHKDDTETNSNEEYALRGV